MGSGRSPLAAAESNIFIDQGDSVLAIVCLILYHFHAWNLQIGYRPGTRHSTIVSFIYFFVYYHVIWIPNSPQDN